MKILLARNHSTASKWNPTQTGLNKHKLLVRITNKSRMARATCTEMESLRPSLYSAVFSVGCNFRDVLPCKVTPLPAAPESQQAHRLSCTWPDSNHTAMEAEQQGELCKPPMIMWNPAPQPSGKPAYTSDSQCEGKAARTAPGVTRYRPVGWSRMTQS